MIASQAAGRLHLGIQRLASSYPLLGGLISSWTIIEGGTATMAVGFSKMRYLLLYNIQFVIDISLDELVGVLHHEVRHVIFGHPFLLKDQYPDDRSLLIATEVSVNEGLPEPLPGQPILLEQYPELQPDESTVIRYQILEKAVDKDSCESEEAVDDHGHWHEIYDNKPIAEMVLKTTIEKIYESIDDISSYEEDLVLGRGFIVGNDMMTLKGTGAAPSILWGEVLRSYIGRLSSAHQSYMRAPRRFPQLLGIVPGRYRQTRKLRLQVVIDTSGSITDQDLEDIVAELIGLDRTQEIIVVENDAKVQRVYRFAGRIDRVAGRGGTDFRPPLDHVFLQKTQADLVIFFTDLDGEFPEQAPQVPVIWVVVPGSKAKAPWGEVLRMDKE